MIIFSYVIAYPQSSLRKGYQVQFQLSLLIGSDEINVASLLLTLTIPGSI